MSRKSTPFNILAGLFLLVAVLARIIKNTQPKRKFSDLTTKLTKVAIRYYQQEIKSGITDRRKLSNYLLTIINKHLPSVKRTDISFIFCTDTYLLEINKQFLSHDTYTDIVTFDLSETDTHLNAEIYISVDRVAENAAKFEANYNHELHRVIFHGLLHLCGFKDKSKQDKEKMRQEENNCLYEYFS